MESIYAVQNLMKGQGSLELVIEIQKKERKKTDNLLFFTSLILAYSTVVMNDLGIDRKVY